MKTCKNVIGSIFPYMKNFVVFVNLFITFGSVFVEPYLSTILPLNTVDISFFHLPKHKYTQ